MGFSGGVKVALDPQMNLRVPAREPTSSAAGQLPRLREFLHPQQIAIESARSFLFARRHGELNMVDAGESQHAIIVSHLPELESGVGRDRRTANQSCSSC
jgi:hypothetical protein